MTDAGSALAAPSVVAGQLELNLDWSSEPQPLRSGAIGGVGARVGHGTRGLTKAVGACIINLLQDARGTHGYFVHDEGSCDLTIEQNTLIVRPSC
jgi:hypothetical protein